MTRTRSYTSISIYKYICLYTYKENHICIDMPIKLKPSSKDYQRDTRGRMLNKWTWKHYTVSNTSTPDLLKYHKSLPRKRNVIERELTRRGIAFN